jgi:2-dehydropantoate 2-reductase
VRILVIGAGAIGGLVGGKLALAGEQVTLVGRPRFAAAVAENGLRLHMGDDAQTVRDITVRDIAAVGSMGDAFANEQSYDLAILTVKSYDTATALDELIIAATGQPRPLLLSLQNGVGNEESIVAAFGASQVIAGTLTTPVSVPAPATIRVDRPSYTMGLSAWSSNMPAEPLAATHATLLRAGFKVKMYPHAQGMKWTKLLMNMMGNATSAILDQPPAQLFADERVVDLEIAAWREALAVMAAAHIPPVNLGSYPFAWLAPLIRVAPNALLRPILRRQVAGARGDKLPSLHIDLHQGKLKSEINWLNGAIVEQGKAVGVATPVNQVLTDIVTALMGDSAAQNEWRGKVGKLSALETK